MPSDIRPTPEIATVRLTLPRRLVLVFTPLLGAGVQVPGEGHATLATLLTDGVGIDPAYVRDRLQTLFVDGDPVDDPAATPLRPGAVVALSAAMPGLAGAILRRRGFYAPLRAPHRSAAAAESDPAGRITLKLFNLVARELGPELLNRGVVVDARALLDAIRRFPAVSREGRISFGRRALDRVNADELAARLAGCGPHVRLEVRTTAA